jgi:hypothetical protein
MKGDGESEMDSVKEEGIHTRNILDQFTAGNPLMAFRRPLVLTNLGKREWLRMGSKPIQLFQKTRFDE